MDSLKKGVKKGELVVFVAACNVGKSKLKKMVKVDG